ncbi:adenylate/guanylate cyclase domain-containing protein, partial [Thermodesulfobacteriota bacterium]
GLPRKSKNRKDGYRIYREQSFALLLVITVLSIGLYSYNRNSKAILDLTEDHFQNLREIVIKEAIIFLRPVATMTKLSSQIFSQFDFTLPRSPGFEKYAVELIKQFPQIEMFSIADEKGNFLMPKRLPDGTIATKIINRNEEPATVIWKYRDGEGRVIKRSKSVGADYDPRVRPWYMGAKGARTVHWTDTYIFFTDQVPGITASHPIINKQGEFAGVLGLDIKLRKLSDFLGSLKIGKTGIAFIVNGKGEVVAYPDFSRITIKKKGILRPAQIDELGVPWISAFFKARERTKTPQMIFETAGKRYIGTLIDFPKTFSGGWKLAIIAPEDDFIGPVKKTRNITILISLVMLLAAIGCAVVLSKSISRPILLISEETERIRDFNLKGTLEIKSYIREIQVLMRALKSMKASLRSFTRYAPEEIVKEVVTKGREAILEGEKREVTVLFCDLRGFTKFSEKTRPEEVVSLINDHFDVMVRIISRYRGFVVDFLGDSVFAAFGALEPDPTHAKHAVTCAVEMQIERERLNEEQRSSGLPVMEMGIGINTGPCVVGNMGSTMRIKYGVVGHGVNLGARIESFTVGGQVLISHETYEAVKDEVIAEGPFQVWGKGVGEAIRIWDIRAVKGDSSLRLSQPVTGLKELVEPVDVEFRLIRGKQIDTESYGASLVRLAERGAELRPDIALEAFSTIQILLRTIKGKSVPLDGKVVGAGEAPGTFMVRFTVTDDLQTEAISLLLKESV